MWIGRSRTGESMGWPNPTRRFPNSDEHNVEFIQATARDPR
jgi:hypothetical protein